MFLELRITATVSYLDDSLQAFKTELTTQQTNLQQNAYQTRAETRIAGILVDEARVWNEVELLWKDKDLPISEIANNRSFNTGELDLAP